MLTTSTVYRQSSRRAAAGQANVAEDCDPENCLLWRSDLRRLDAEVIRDSVLAVCGTLDASLGGASAIPQMSSSGLVTVDAEPNSTDYLRRSLYLFARRNYSLVFLEVLDAPIMPVNRTRRDSGASVFQSLTFLNADFVMDQAGNILRHRDGPFRSEPADAGRSLSYAFVQQLVFA